MNPHSFWRDREYYIDSLEWLRNIKAIVNPKNNDNNCFPYALGVTLNHENIEKIPQRISKIKSFINQLDWKEINFPLDPSKDCKIFELNNKAIALNILFVPYNTENIRFAYKSKQNLSVKIK